MNKYGGIAPENAQEETHMEAEKGKDEGFSRSSTWKEIGVEKKVERMRECVKEDIKEIRAEIEVLAGKIEVLADFFYQHMHVDNKLMVEHRSDASSPSLRNLLRNTIEGNPRWQLNALKVRTEKIQKEMEGDCYF